MEQLLTVLIGTTCKLRTRPEPSGSGRSGALRLALAAAVIVAGFGALNRVAQNWPASVSVAYNATQQGR